MARIGIRELRQNASEYVHRAERGETIEITDRGRPAARLTPIPSEGSLIDRLIAEGKMKPATGDIRALGPPPPPSPGAKSLSEVLDEMREDRI